jgi:hypothetical protein
MMAGSSRDRPDIFMPTMGLGILSNSLNHESKSRTSVRRNLSPVEGPASEITKKNEGTEKGSGGRKGEDIKRFIHLEARKKKTKKRHFRKQNEALDSGPAELPTDADWIALRQEAVDGLAGESIRP